MTTHDESRSGWDTRDTLKRRGSTSVDASQRKESLLDVSIEESFPASDASSSVQPGSLAAEELSPKEI